MTRCTCGAMLTSVDAICETCLPARRPMRALLEQDYREKCAALEENMLGWKESAEAWERDAKALSDRARAAERERDEAGKAGERMSDALGSIATGGSAVAMRDIARAALATIKGPKP